MPDKVEFESVGGSRAGGMGEAFEGNGPHPLH